MDEEHTKEPSHNNPEEAANYIKAVDNLLKKFVSNIHGFNPYARQDAYKNFLHILSLLLSKLDNAYFTNMDTELVLDTIPDKECTTFLEHPEETTEEYCCNLILPRPFHPKFSGISFKHPTRCLAAAVPFFNKKRTFQFQVPTTASS